MSYLTSPVIDQVTGFITRDVAVRELADNAINALGFESEQHFQKAKELLGPDWIHYNKPIGSFSYDYDSLGFRNPHNLTDLDDGYILVVGQSPIENPGLPWEETLPGCIQSVTGIQTYNMAISGLDTLSVVYNLAHALDPKYPKPSAVIFCPTIHAITTLVLPDSDDHTLLNVSGWLADMKYALSESRGIPIDWLVSSLDFFQAGVKLNYPEQINRFLRPIAKALVAAIDPDIKFVLIEMAHEGGELPENGTAGRNPDVFIPMYERRDEIFLKQMEQGLKVDPELTLEYANTRARDLFHHGYGINLKGAEDIKEFLDAH